MRMKWAVLFILAFIVAGCAQNKNPISPFHLSGFWSSGKLKTSQFAAKGKDAVPSSESITEIIEVPSEMILGPGDELNIVVKKHEKLSGNYTILKDGLILFPLIHSIKAEGMTVQEFKQALIKALSRYIRRPAVEIEATTNKQVIVYGAVGDLDGNRQMKIYPLGKPTRVLSFIASAGGPRTDADIRNISIVHPDGTRDKVDLNRILFHGEMDRNVFIQPGDLLYVPSHTEEKNKVLVLGAVKSPGLYSFKSNISALEATALAGSFTNRSSPERTFVIRSEAENPYLLRVNLKKVLTRGEAQRDILLKRGDIVFVPDAMISNYNRYVSRIMPTLNLLERVTGLVIDTDTIMVLFDRGFGEAQEDEVINEAELQRAAEREAEQAASRAVSAATAAQ